MLGSTLGVVVTLSASRTRVGPHGGSGLGIIVALVIVSLVRSLLSFSLGEHRLLLERVLELHLSSLTTFVVNDSAWLRSLLAQELQKVHLKLLMKRLLWSLSHGLLVPPLRVHEPI